MIRPALASDVENISLLLCSLTNQFIAKDLEKAGLEIMLNSMQPDAIRNNLNSGFSYSVALIDNEIVGVIGVKGHDHLYHLFVAELFQGQGIAKQLWLSVLNDLEPLYTSEYFVNASLNAVHFYKHLGFIASSDVEIKNGIKFVPMKFTATSNAD